MGLWEAQRSFDRLTVSHSYRPQTAGPIAYNQRPTWITSTHSEILPLTDGFSYTVSHIPGKDLTVADTLSRAPTELSNFSDEEFQEEVEAFVNVVLQQSEITSGIQLKDIMENQLHDETCQVLTKYCQSEWPDRSHTASCAKRYYPVAS